MPTAPVILESGSGTVQTRRTAPGTGDQVGVVGASRAGWLVMQVSPGSALVPASLQPRGRRHGDLRQPQALGDSVIG